jgi:hypothetical protein
MTSLQPNDRAELRKLERRFLETLRQTFSRVLETSAEPADYYWASLSRASSEERLLALHDDPLDVAVALTDVTVTPEMTSRYRELISVIPPDEAASMQEELFEVPPRQPFTPRIPRTERVLRPALFSMTRIVGLMEHLGYTRSGGEGHVVAWRLTRAAAPGLPDLVATTLIPTSVTVAFGERYGVQSILDIYDQIIVLASERGAPPQTLRMLRELRDNFARSPGTPPQAL